MNREAKEPFAFSTNNSVEDECKVHHSQSVHAYIVTTSENVRTIRFQSKQKLLMGKQNAV